ncbi:YIP1 family protein [Defluviimonas sp. SAOS-178_SWC]|uniref:YIP1 family protein n=1 Tax=Defluviimonas sp. SAOS-178_SWC TaxID=3121287 RepID=UPI0032215286
MSGWRDLLVDLARETLRSPRKAAGRLVALDPPMEARWLALLFVAVFAVFETRLALFLMPIGAESGVFAILGNPWLGVPAQIASLVLIAAAMAWIGGLFGGGGRFADALLLVVWLEFLLTVAQAVQMVAMLVLPPLGALLAIGVLAGFLWLMVQFTAALHGFQNLFKVFLGMVAGFVVIVTTLAMLFGALGIVTQV